MRVALILILSLVAVINFTSCSKFIAKDITDKTPVLIVPTANDTSAVNPVYFKWEAMEGATKYHLEIVSPSFSNISSFVYDTIVTSTSISLSLDSAGYEMRLTALNAGYQSLTLGPIAFWVGVQPTINTSTVVLNSPGANAYVNGSFASPFQWNTLPNALSYEFTLRKGTSFQSGNIEIQQNNIVTTNYTLPSSYTITEGTYFWGVKAYFASGETAYTIRTFKVDTNVPNTPQLLNPVDNFFASLGANTFTWSNGSDIGTIQAPVNSRFQLASDASFTTLVKDTTFIGATKTVNINTAGSYFWRVQNIDSAQNQSPYSTTRTLLVN